VRPLWSCTLITPFLSPQPAGALVMVVVVIVEECEGAWFRRSLIVGRLFQDTDNANGVVPEKSWRVGSAL